MVTPDPTTALVGRLFEASLGAMDLLSIYIGDRLGLYRALAAASKGLTSAQLANAAGIDERYAREWLEQQAATGLVEVGRPSADPLVRRYILPSANAEVLLDEESLNYFAPMARLLASVAGQLPKLLKAYKSGGGVSWAAFGASARESQAAFNRPMYMKLLAKEYLPSIKDIHDRLMKGRPARVADIACGGGWSSIAIAKAYPNTQVDGYDLDEPSIRLARKNAKAESVSDRVTFYCTDAAGMERRYAYDLVLVLEAIHDMPRPVEVLKTVRGLAGRDGAVVVMDERVGETFEAPANPVDRFMYGASILVCLPDSMSHKPTAATGTVMRPTTLRKYALAAGFKDVEVLSIENDFFRFYRLT